MDEIRPIPGWPEYGATADGRIWSYRSEIFLKPKLSKRHGYYDVTLVCAQRRWCVRVHRLIALTWIPNPLGKPEVNHSDGIKTHNASSNLEWATSGENTRHADASGLRHPRFGERHKSSKLTESQVREIRRPAYVPLELVNLVAHELNIHPFTIYDIRKRKSWKHIE
jgi:hypothetical protein